VRLRFLALRAVERSTSARRTSRRPNRCDNNASLV
jgi:hypothetical protein